MINIVYDICQGVVISSGPGRQKRFRWKGISLENWNLSFVNPASTRQEHTKMVIFFKKMRQKSVSEASAIRQRRAIPL